MSETPDFQLASESVKTEILKLYSIHAVMTKERTFELMFTCGHNECDFHEITNCISVEGVGGDDWAMLINFGIQHVNDHVELDGMGSFGRD